jgi:hypothetical protein
MSKRPNLAALADAAGSLRVARAVGSPGEPEPHSKGRAPADRPAGSLAPSRIGQKPITAFFPEAVRIQLKMMAAEQSRTMEGLIGEALNDLFAKHGKPEIAPSDGNAA